MTIETLNDIQNKKNICCPVYSQKLAGYLMLKGFHLVDIAPNHKFPNMSVFFFKNSPEIKLYIREYKNTNQ